jgi:flagellar biosynthetic protein FliQ
MDTSQALDVGRNALLMVLTISAPIMGIGMGVGLIVSLFQSMTQLQEQTLSFVPKILSMVIVAIVLVPWIANRLLEYTVSMLGTTPF